MNRDAKRLRGVPIVSTSFSVSAVILTPACHTAKSGAERVLTADLRSAMVMTMSPHLQPNLTLCAIISLAALNAGHSPYTRLQHKQSHLIQLSFSSSLLPAFRSEYRSVQAFVKCTASSLFNGHMLCRL